MWSLLVDLKFFGWNIGCSSTKDLNKIDKSIRDEFHPKNQFSNLQRVIKDSKLTPDLLILGEYCPKYFDKKNRCSFKGLLSTCVSCQKTK